MQFQSEANNLDIVSDVKYWCGIDSSDTTSYPIKDITRNANFALDRIHGLIIRADGMWEYDDNNNSASELLDTSTAITSGTRKYAIPITWLKVARVRIKDSFGEWHTLRPNTRRNWSKAELSGESGVPTEYDLLGNWLYLNYNPNWSISGGLEVQLQKGASYFAYTDTTKTPGFVAQFHRLVSLQTSLDYTENNDMEKRSAKIRNRIGRPPTEVDAGAGMERELVEFYATRNVDMVPNMRVQQEDYGQGALVDTPGGNNNPNGF